MRNRFTFSWLPVWRGSGQEPGRDRRLAQAIRRFVEFYAAWQKPDEAAKWQSELDKISPTASARESIP